MRALLAFLMLGSGTATADEFEMPSGQFVSPFQVLWEHQEVVDENWMFLRFIAPSISREAGGLTFSEVAGDLDYICAQYGLAVLEVVGGTVSQIVVQIMASPIERGAADPTVTQFMSAYRVDTGACVWE